MGQYFGQEQIDAATDSRGVIGKDLATQIRDARAAEQWERFDSIAVFEGAANLSRGWFNTFADLASVDQLQWFSGRDTGAGPSYTNQTTERTDWAQDLYQTTMEFLCPMAFGDLEENPNEGTAFTQQMWVNELPRMMGMRVVLAEADEIAKVPANHMPAGFGTSSMFYDGSAAPTAQVGSVGVPAVSNAFYWPEPIMLAAKAKLTVYGSIDAPLRRFLQQLPGPGAKLVPDGAGGFIRLPNVYEIRITMRGPRYLQLRGARSAA